MDLNLLFALVIALLVLIITLVVYDIRKRVQGSMSTKDEAKTQTVGDTDAVLVEIAKLRQDLSRFRELVATNESRSESKMPPVKMDNLSDRVDQALSDIEFLKTYFKIQNGINEYGSRIREVSYEFISRVEDEIGILERQELQGREYVLRSNMLFFSLMMAKIYVEIVGPRDSLSMIEMYLERAKKLV